MRVVECMHEYLQELVNGSEVSGPEKQQILNETCFRRAGALVQL